MQSLDLRSLIAMRYVAAVLFAINEIARPLKIQTVAAVGVSVG